MENFLELKIFELTWRTQMYNVIAIYEVAHVIKISTFVPFNHEHCNDTMPLEFGLENLFHRKMKNFHGCPIRVATTNDSMPFAFATRFKNGSYDHKGSDITTLRNLAKSLNS